jgi:hypothetical protein
MTETELKHYPMRHMTLTSSPPQYYCFADKELTVRNECYCHITNWSGWADYDEWLDRQPVTRGELKKMLEDLKGK